MLLLPLVICAVTADQAWAETVRQATLSAHNAARRHEAKAEHASNIYELVIK
jgi:hypothetical protein